MASGSACLPPCLGADLSTLTRGGRHRVDTESALQTYRTGSLSAGLGRGIGSGLTPEMGSANTG
jgi:hypothetical protein